MRSRPLGLGVGVFLLSTTSAWALDLTACNAVPAGESGVLQNDVDCNGGTLTLAAASSLDLNGFTVTGDVVCAGGSSCRIVSSPSLGGVVGRVGVDKGTIENVAIDCDGADVGVTVARKLRAREVSITGCAAYGIYRQVGAVSVKADSLSVVGNGVGMELNTGRLKGKDVEVSGNASAGIYAGKVLLDGVTAVGNGGWAVSAAKRVKVRGGTITGNAAGVVVPLGKATVKDSDVSGNGIDIASFRPPTVLGTTCGTSRMIVDIVIQTDSWLACPGE